MTNIVFMFSAFVTVACSPMVALVAQGKPEVGGIAFVIPGPGGLDLENLDLFEIGAVRAPIGLFVKIETENSMNALYASGALLVVDGKKVLQLCTT